MTEFTNVYFMKKESIGSEFEKIHTAPSLRTTTSLSGSYPLSRASENKCHLKSETGPRRKTYSHFSILWYLSPVLEFV